jgi:catechol 2,3-dioxygenase-like lactoylglutathione lyase family enzyme
MLIGPPVPILRIFDVAKAIEFYVGFLGFHEDWRHRFGAEAPIYMQVSRDGVALHLSEHHGDGCPGAAIRIAVTDIDAYCAELIAKKYRYYRPGVEGTEWNTLEMTVLDPFRNRLSFWVPANKSNK